MEPIGLVAGSGRFPVLFARAAAAAGRSVVAAAHEGETDPELERHVERLAWVKLGQLGRIAEVLREAGCREAVFCGGLRKVRLFDLRPDWLGVKVLAGLRSFGRELGFSLSDLRVGFLPRGFDSRCPLLLLSRL